MDNFLSILCVVGRRPAPPPFRACRSTCSKIADLNHVDEGWHIASDGGWGGEYALFLHEATWRETPSCCEPPPPRGQELIYESETQRERPP